jgi:hypothetical protein
MLKLIQNLLLNWENFDQIQKTLMLLNSNHITLRRHTYCIKFKTISFKKVNYLPQAMRPEYTYSKLTRIAMPHSHKQQKLNRTALPK